MHGTSVVSAAGEAARATVLTGEWDQALQAKDAAKHIFSDGMICGQQLPYSGAASMCIPVKGPEWLCIAGSANLLSETLTTMGMAARMGYICAAYVCSGSQNMLLKPWSLCAF